MKQVIFLCLLSLTLCLSKPAEQEIPSNHAVGDAKPDTPIQQAPVLPTVPQTTQKPAPADQAPQTSAKPPAHSEIQTPATTEGNKTSEKKDDTKPNTTRQPTVDTSTVSNNTAHGPPSEAPNASHNNTPNVAPSNAPNTSNNTNTDTKPAGNGNAKPEEIVTPPKPKSPEAPKAEEPKTPNDADKHIVQARGFDGPSFIGGIILSLGLLAVGFMGFKYYKIKTDRNYHTL